jgi:hypothetical protein
MSKASISKRSQKQVSFSKQAFVYRVTNFSDCRYQSLIWYSVDEMADSKREAAQLAQALEMVEASTSHEDWRGLEARSPQGRWKAYKTRLDASNAVLDAHDQKVTSKELSTVAKKVSAASVDQAIARGRVDAQIAAGYCNNKHASALPCGKIQKCSTFSNQSPSLQTHRLRRIGISPAPANLIALRS